MKVKAYLDVLTFINMVADKDLPLALSFSTSNLRQYTVEPNKIKLPTKKLNGKEDAEIDVAGICALICYIEPENSDLSFLLSEGQRQIIANLINNEVLSKWLNTPIKFNLTSSSIGYGNKNSKGSIDSNLERLFKQLILSQELLLESKHNAGK